MNTAHRFSLDYQKDVTCESVFGSFIIDYGKHCNAVLLWTIKMDQQLQPQTSVGIIAVDESQNIDHLLNANCFSKDTSSKGVKAYYGLNVSSHSLPVLDTFEVWNKVNIDFYLHPGLKQFIYLKQCRYNFIKMELNIKQKTLSYWINDWKYNKNGIAFRNMEDMSKYKYR
eukprot:UN12616